MTGERDIADQAAAWVLRLADPAAGEVEGLAFLAWLDGDPAGDAELRRAAFDRTQAVWLAFDQVEAPRLTSANVADFAATRRRMPRERRIPAMGAAAWTGLAAAAVLLVSAGVWTLSKPQLRQPARGPSGPATFSTAVGQTRTIHMADGSRIDLDGATVMSVASTVGERRVEMRRGEASFDVVHDPRRPFIVDVGVAQVRVLGTAFDIDREGANAQIAVARGVVSVETPRQSVRLPAGTLARLEADGTVRSAAIPASDVGDWRNGRQVYVDAPLTVIVADLNRRYARPIRIAGEQAGQIHFTGVLVLDSQARTVRRLTALLPLSARTGDHGEIVLGSPRRP